MKQKFKIFTDFDGTIALNDVGDSLFERFAEDSWQDAVQDWKDGKISSKQCFIHLCEVTNVTKKQVQDFCDEQKIDSAFKDFVSYCGEMNYPITVLSDGLLFYIRRILDNYGFQELEIFANDLIFLDHNKIEPEFPYYENGCLDCGNCKGYHIKQLKNDGETIVIIGDGFSDRCAVVEADIVFAKDDLKEYCLQNDIGFYGFNSFKDVLDKLKEIEKIL